MAAMPEEGENFRQDLQENHRAGNQKAENQVFDWTLWRGWPPSK
jgi:hypothetical protein